MKTLFEYEHPNGKKTQQIIPFNIMKKHPELKAGVRLKSRHGGDTWMIKMIEFGYGANGEEMIKITLIPDFLISDFTESSRTVLH